MDGGFHGPARYGIRAVRDGATRLRRGRLAHFLAPAHHHRNNII
jgi:hypothetical protein